MVQHLPGAEGSGIHENSLDTWHVSPKLAELPLHQCHQTIQEPAGQISLCKAFTHGFWCNLQMITHSRVIMTVLLVDMLALLMYNVSGMCVTGKFTARISSCGSDTHRVPGNLSSECSPVDTTVSALARFALFSHQAW